ncbi:hypothetical protein [Polyangium jinanense]|uniref:hypothetical protein n=1 Tax=Polyangium jinanense TaxID=2829994 RepID=UPI00233FA09E|nr:hypothetical protein [Polyangium jinanense]
MPRGLSVVGLAWAPSCIILSAGLVLLAGCSPREKKKGRYDAYDGGVPPFREECIVPGDNCYRDCHDREASVTCVGCCRDQDFLCNTQQQHSFESCKTVK